MKKGLLIFVVILAASATLPAMTNMVDLGLSAGTYLDWPMDTFVTRDISLSWIRLGADDYGFYSQLSPYYSISGKNKVVDATWKYSDYDWLGLGVETILGYGGDFNFGSLGLIVGGGGYADINYYSLTYDYLFLSFGLGGGAHVYFQTGGGDFLVNAGLAVAWKPWYTFQDLTNDFGDSDFDGGRFDVTFSVGVGMRTGGSSRSRSSSSSSSDGGDDDW